MIDPTTYWSSVSILSSAIIALIIYSLRMHKIEKRNSDLIKENSDLKITNEQLIKENAESKATIVNLNKKILAQKTAPRFAIGAGEGTME